MLSWASASRTAERPAGHLPGCVPGKGGAPEPRAPQGGERRVSGPDRIGALAQEAPGERALLPRHPVHLEERAVPGIHTLGDGAEGALGLGVPEP